jgi:hypothetical protein
VGPGSTALPHPMMGCVLPTAGLILGIDGTPTEAMCGGRAHATRARSSATNTPRGKKKSAASGLRFSWWDCRFESRMASLTHGLQPQLRRAHRTNV